MCRNQEILPVSASLFLRYLLISNLLRLWDTLYLLFANPDFSASGKLIYAYITYISMMLIYTAINIPYSAMLGVITPSSQERTSLSTFRFVCAFTGQLLIVAAARPLIAKFGEGNEAAGFQITMAIFAVGLFVITFLSTKERVHPPASQTPDLRKELRLLLRNTPWIILSFAGVLTLANVAIRGAVTVHYFKYYIGDDGTPWIGVFDRTTVFMTSGTLALIAGVACTPFFTRLAGKRELMIWLSLGNAIAMASFFFIPPEATMLMLVVNIIGTCIVGPTPALV
ncbi:MAG: MFS transporter [Candidatus Synoicihabitans palmerolidicus]|nr:MFS transporter [Candidatus Synoicihabitans palmerolidicus]